MKLQTLRKVIHNPRWAFWLAFERMVINTKAPHYNEELYDFCTRYVNFYRNDQSGDRDSNGAWRWLAEFMRTNPKIIFDVGGFDGEYSLKILEANPRVELHVFEPDPVSFAKK